MQRNMLKSKIHRAFVTDADIGYEGSITIDRALMEAADLVPYEEVHVWDITNGSRITTYVIEGEHCSGTIAINGAAAHLMKRGDRVIIGSFVTCDEDEIQDHVARKVFVDDENHVQNIEIVRVGASESARMQQSAQKGCGAS